MTLGRNIIKTKKPKIKKSLKLSKKKKNNSKKKQNNINSKKGSKLLKCINKLNINI